MDISRKAELYETSSGMITITGGKLTTWRRMAKMAVDRLVERDGREAPCRTHEIPLGQPADWDSLPFERVDAAFVGHFNSGFSKQDFPAPLLLQSLPELRFKPTT